MRADRELLDLAAKAVGIELMFPTRISDVWPRRKDTWDLWNPLQDDGDALRLAVRLQLIVSNPGIDSWAQSYSRGDDEWLTTREPHGHDPYASTRRAIVQAAASIQQAKEAK